MKIHVDADRSLVDNFECDFRAKNLAIKLIDDDYILEKKA